MVTQSNLATPPVSVDHFVPSHSRIRPWDVLTSTADAIAMVCDDDRSSEPHGHAPSYAPRPVDKQTEGGRLAQANLASRVVERRYPLTLGNHDQMVVDEVRRHYGESQAPYYLAVLGEFLRSRQIAVPPGVRLKDYLRDRLQGQLSVVQDQDVPAKIAVALPDNQDLVRQRLTARFPGTPSGSAADFDRLPYSLKVAFCVVPPDGTRVYFRTVPPFRYVFGSSAPDETFVEIEEEFRPTRLIGSLVRNLSIEDRNEVYQHIAAWASAKNIELGKIRYGRNPASTDSPDSNRPITANGLQRLIQAQEVELRRRILIPADIAITLMRTP